LEASVEKETKDADDEGEALEEEEVYEDEEEDEMATEYQHGIDWLMTSMSESSSGADKTHCTRRIIAEDPSWTLSIVPSLADSCIRHIADNFCC